MKRIGVAVAWVGILVASASCDKGTLGTPSGGGQTGTLDGIAGASVSAGRAGAGGFFGEGAGGDSASGFAGIGDPGTAGAGGGFGGRGGPGGSGFMICPPPTVPACGYNACGNGSIDTCQVATG